MVRNAGELAEYLGAKLVGDARTRISGVANPEDAGAEDVIYADSARNLERTAKSKAICILAPMDAPLAIDAQPTAATDRPLAAAMDAQLAGKTVIHTANPKLGFAKAAAWLMPSPTPAAGIHPTAVVALTAKVAKSATIGPYAVIEDNVLVGEKTWIDAFCFVGKESKIGSDCRLHPHVTLYAGANLGDRVELHSGAVIGGDGFGYVYAEGRQWKFPQLGSITLENDVEIGCNTTVDRGSLGSTRIGADTKIDNLVQVGHNVQIGEHSILVSQVGISGSTTLGKCVVVAGQAGFGDHAVVEDNVVIGGQAGVLPGKVIRSGQVVWGTPSRPLKKFKEQHGWFARLPELARRLGILEKHVATLTKVGAKVGKG
jgi:UDP-3-O-[3-hydroxymyristoyl] glucosamine N-acyltransferase